MPTCAHGPCQLEARIGQRYCPHHMHPANRKADATPEQPKDGTRWVEVMAHGNGTFSKATSKTTRVTLPAEPWA